MSAARSASDPASGSRSWLVAWGPPVAYALAIFGLSSIADMPAPPLGVSDKDAHFLLYTGFAATLAWAFTGGRLDRLGWRAALAALVVASLYGVTDELHQWFVEGRSCDIRDWMADTAGASLAAVAIVATAWWRRRSLTSGPHHAVIPSTRHRPLE